MKENISKIEALRQILQEKRIYPVYQPIVSLKTGSVLGYEALSRIDGDFDLEIEPMFQLADRMGKSWELESLCRNQSLAAAQEIQKDKKLFINMNPNILYDEEFKRGFTKKHLDEYGIDARHIIFEINERTAIIDQALFQEAVRHYQNQHYEIAIDDTGAGYSGLNLICDINPHYIKIDMNLVHNIDQDDIKQSMVRSLVQFSKRTGAHLIAEGIETAKELAKLIELEVELGQGFFLKRPQKTFTEPTTEALECILSINEDLRYRLCHSSIYKKIGDVCKSGHRISPNALAIEVLEMFRKDPSITEFCAVDEKQKVVGFITRDGLFQIFSGQYGFSLYQKKKIGVLMSTDFLEVAVDNPVDEVSRLAMERPADRLYHSIVVVSREKSYRGVVSVKTLLESAFSIEVSRAKYASPLTGLPGNLVINDRILKSVSGTEPYCILHIDVDNFKAYNDGYGFEQGDLMLKMLGDILTAAAGKEDFIGHIGGDDFVVITDYLKAQQLCRTIVSNFREGVKTLYQPEHVEKGFLISKNRHGEIEHFPLATLSMAGVSNQERDYNMEQLSREIALIKKACKQKQGNCWQINL